jgi:hypothetical protein
MPKVREVTAESLVRWADNGAYSGVGVTAIFGRRRAFSRRTFVNAARALAARDLGLERVELALPEGAELVEPLRGFLQRGAS